MTRSPELSKYKYLVIDATGGDPVIDMFPQARPDAMLVPVKITGGDKVSTNGSTYSVRAVTS